MTPSQVPATSTPATPAALPEAMRPSVTDAKEIAKGSDTRSVMRLGFWVLIVGFGLFLAWAAFAPLDQGVPAPATVSIETRRKAVQHISGGVIQAVQVKEGAVVAEGDVLVVLDDAMAKANHESVRQTYLSQRAAEGRLIAEASGARTISFHPDLMTSPEPQAAQHMQIQRQLFTARRSALTAEIAAANQTIAGLEGQIAGLQQVLVSRRGQASLQGQQLANLQQLAGDGFAPRNQVLQLEQGQAELRASIADIENNVQRARSSIAEARLRIAQREQEFLKEVSGQLADVQGEVQANHERLTAVGQDLVRTQIKAPVGGQVLGLMVNGPGAVVTPGMKLMDIVPTDEALLLDTRVPPHVIDRIKVGDEAEVRFSSFADAPQLVVYGRIVSLSTDVVIEQTPAGANSYYLGRVQLTAEGRSALGQRNLQPGMPAEVLIKTGERSLLAYLLHPLTKRIASAMTEE